MISRGGYFATKQKFILSILLFKSRVKWILDSCWKWGDNYYNQHKSEHLENECKIKPKKQLKKKTRVSNEWKVIFANVSVNSNKFFSCFHSDLSMNNITELPAYVFKNFPYLEELWVHAPPLPPVNDVFILYSVDMRAGLYDMHLGILACTVKCTERALPLSWGR